MNALVIGATGGIGQAIARALAPQTTTLWLSGRNGIILASLAHELGAQAIPADLSSELKTRALLTEVGALDLLVYAAGAVAKKPLRELAAGDWGAVEAANLRGAYYALKHAQFTPSARAVFLGVYPSFVSVPGMAAYAASKAGLEALLAVTRKEYRRDGVRFILVRLPAVATPLWAPLGGAPQNAMHPEEAAGRILDGLRAEPTPEEIAL